MIWLISWKERGAPDYTFEPVDKSQVFLSYDEARIHLMHWKKSVVYHIHNKQRHTLKPVRYERAYGKSK